MQVVTNVIVLLLFFCKTAELRNTKHGIVRTRPKEGGASASKKTVKRFAPVPQCDEYVYLNEKYLDCQEKKLTHISADWSSDIIHMLLARNRFRRLKNDTFAKFINLKSLDLQQNSISKIEEEAFVGLTKLTTLLLQHNRIKTLSEEIFIYLPRLNYLRLYDNPWDCTCQLESLVRMLQIPGSRNLGNYAKCESPDTLKSQKLKYLRPESLCPEVEKYIPADEKPISLIKPVDFDSTLCHTYMFPKPAIDCQNQGLYKVPADVPTDIVKFDLSKNKIQKLGAKAFITVKELKVLNLSSNAIEHIDPAAFSGLTHLRELDLTNNALHDLEYGVLEDLYFVQKLWLGENPWRCDYSIHYLVYWLQHHYTVEYKGLECKMPEEYKGWFVGDYIKSYYEDCPKDKIIVQSEATGQDTEEEEERDPQAENLIQKEQKLTIFFVG
uniref:Leucine rich repeat containing 17 n=1 Tax=Latimeria chalumnae TaxID=7897 RepID=H3AKT3_LATCH